MVRLASGFGDSKAVATALDQFHGRGERNAVAYRDIYGLHRVASPQHLADFFAIEPERCGRPGVKVENVMLPNEQRLGAADRRLVKHDAQVAGDAKKTRMGAAVAVNENQVRLRAQASKSRGKRRPFAEGEQTGNVRKTQFEAGGAPLNFLHLGEAIDDDSCEGRFGFGIEGEVCACNKTDVLELVFEHDASAQAFLLSYRLARSEVPAGFEPGIHAFLQRDFLMMRRPTAEWYTLLHTHGHTNWRGRVRLQAGDSMKLINFEFKARLRDESVVRRALKRLRARYLGEDHQIDTYFKVARGRLKVREGKIENALIFYNRTNAACARQSNVEMMLLPRLNSMKKILRRVLEVRAVVNKRREIYFVGTVKVHVDRVRGLGRFVEVEAISRSGDIAQARRLASKFRKLFCIPTADIVGKSYSDLVKEKLRR